MRRREFVTGSLVGSFALLRANSSANDTVRVAVIGVRGRGRVLAASFANQRNTEVAYLCDVDQRVFAPVLKLIEEISGRKPQVITDLRRALDDPHVDAVVIATPDHWHAPATLLACQAAKDVYVEKPASHNYREGRWMIAAARRYERVVQVGTQARSRPSVQRAIEFINSGKIGRVLMAKAWNTQMRRNIGRAKDSKPPAEVDYETWVGPAPWLPYRENRFHYNWHWWWNFGTGDIGNDGVHQLDIARWALGVDLPIAVYGMGRKLYFDDDQQTPDTMNITYEFPGGKAIIFEMRLWNPYGMEGQENGVAVYGDDGFVQIGRWNRVWGFRVFDRKGKLVFEDTEPAEHHIENFLEALRTRQRPNADIETGHLSSALSHLGNIVARVGRNIRFDPATESIIGDEQANELLGRSYRQHWATPKTS